MIQIHWANPFTEENRMLGQYVSSRLFKGRRDGFEGFTAMAVVEGVKLLGALIFHNQQRDEGVIEISGYADSPRWLTRTALREMHAFPFDQIGCQLIAMRASATNDHLEKILKRGGYKSYTIPRLRGRDADETIYTLTDDEWRNGAFWRRVRREVNNG